MNIITRDDAIRMVEALTKLHDDTGQLIDEYGHEPAPESQAARELSGFQRRRLVVPGRLTRCLPTPIWTS